MDIAKAIDIRKNIYRAININQVFFNSMRIIYFKPNIFHCIVFTIIEGIISNL